MNSKKIQAAVLSIALIVPAGSAFAAGHRHPKHHSQARGAVIGAVAGAIVSKNKVKGALIGGALGEAVQYERNKKERKGHW